MNFEAKKTTISDDSTWKSLINDCQGLVLHQFRERPIIWFWRVKSNFVNAAKPAQLQQNCICNRVYTTYSSVKKNTDFKQHNKETHHNFIPSLRSGLKTNGPRMCIIFFSLSSEWNCNKRKNRSTCIHTTWAWTAHRIFIFIFFAFCCCCFRAHAPPYRTYNTNHKHNSSVAADAQQISMLCLNLPALSDKNIFFTAHAFSLSADMFAAGRPTLCCVQKPRTPNRPSSRQHHPESHRRRTVMRKLIGARNLSASNPLFTP